MTQVVATGQLPLAGVVVPGETEHLAIVRELVALTWLIGRRDGRQETRHEVKFDQPEEGPLPQHALAFLGARQAMQGKWSRDLDAEVTKVLVHSMQTGADVRTTMQALQRVFPEFGKARLENIARTEATTAYNAGRLAAFQEDTDFVTGVQFHAILDSRTTTICQARNGLILRLDDQRLPANTPPLHYQCRSVLVPVDRIAWRKLEAGDKKAEAAFFGYLEGGPVHLDAALAGWDNTPAPLPGFGTVDGVGKLDRSKGDSSKAPVVYNPKLTAEQKAVVKRLLEPPSGEEIKIHIGPTALSDGLDEDRKAFKSIEAVRDEVEKALNRVPTPLARLWVKSEARLEIIGDYKGDDHRKAGSPGWFEPSSGTAQVLTQGLRRPGVVDEEIVHLLDFLLGERAQGKYASDGYGRNKEVLERFSKPLNELFQAHASELGEYASKNPHEFLAQGLRLFMGPDGSQILQEHLPSVYTFLQECWFSSSFWEEIL